MSDRSRFYRIPASTRRLALVVGLLAAGSVSTALADGKFFYLRGAVVEDPQVRFQRGLVCWRDGVETLIVQSTIDAGAAELAWVLPLPAPPTEILACPPKTLENLAELTSPRVQHRSPHLDQGLVVIVFGAAGLAAALAKPPRGLRILLYGLLAFVGTAILLPSLVADRALPGVEVLTSTPAGVYDVRIIRSESAAAIAGWLDSNGFAAAPQVRPVLEDYVRKQWCFAVAQVRAEKAESFAHHPVRFTFPSATAVYPLRLTGVGQEPLTLELFIIGPQGAELPGLSIWMCDGFRLDKQLLLSRHHLYTAPTAYEGREFDQHIGLPGISDCMWEGCWVTRLRGKLAGAQLGEDLAVNWIKSSPQIATLRTRRAEVQSAVALGLVGVGAGWLLTAVFVVVFRWNSRRAAYCGVIPAVAVGAVLVVGSLAVQDSVQLASHNTVRDMYQAAGIHQEVLNALRTAPPITSFPDAYRAMVERKFRDRFGSARPDLADRVYNYTIEPADDGWNLTFEANYHIPVTVKIDSDGRPRLRASPPLP